MEGVMKYLSNDSLSFYFRRVITRRWLFGVLTVLLALGMPGTMSATSMSPVKLISINNDGTDSGSGFSRHTSLSADGRFVAFWSDADDLVNADSNGMLDVFVRDNLSETTTLVSVNKQGTDSGAGRSTLPVISADGRYVAFSSNADDLVTTDNNGTWDVFVRDLQSGTTTLVSVNKDGTGSGTSASGYCDCGITRISADGRFVVFFSRAADLVTTDTNDSVDVFVRDLKNGTTTLVSVNKDGSDSGASESSFPVISADGRFVAFQTSAGDLVATDTNGKTDVFVRDLQHGTTTLVSVNKDGTDSGSGESLSNVISADGRYVAFSSNADNLVATDSNGTRDIFVRDIQNETTTLVSVNKDGIDSGTGYSRETAVSADGRFVVFSSEAGDLVTTDSNDTWDVFVRDIQSGTTTLVSVNKDGTDSGASHSGEVEISADGRYVAFSSYADNLVTTDSNGTRDVFVRDLQSGTTTLVSANKQGTDSGAGRSRAPVISADGRVVAFRSEADNLVATDTNGVLDVFAFEVFKAPQGCNCAVPGVIKGTSGPDFLYGTEQADIICGLRGDDFIAGMGGDDCIDGGNGNDWIYGGRGDDKIFGGPGKDVVYGHRGNDKINGNKGEDHLFGGSGDDILNGGKGYDWIFCGRGTDVGIGEYTRGCEN
jgi:Tol biopolymer transport system component